MTLEDLCIQGLLKLDKDMREARDTYTSLHNFLSNEDMRNNTEYESLYESLSYWNKRYHEAKHNVDEARELILKLKAGKNDY